MKKSKTLWAYFGENRQVSQDSLVLFFSNYGSPRLYPYHLVGGNGGRGPPTTLASKFSEARLKDKGLQLI